MPDSSCAAKPAANTPYGGQAVIEGIMIRGPRYVSLACRLPQADGQPGVDTPIDVHTELIASPYVKRPWLRKVAFVRGIVSLYEMLNIGLRGLQRSANLALPAQAVLASLPLLTATADDLEAPAATGGDTAGSLNGPLLWATIAASFGIGLLLFVVFPHWLASWLCTRFGWTSSVTLNAIEGVLRLTVFVVYVGLIGRMKDIQRVFAYHGAEHRVVNAWEARRPGDQSPISVAEARGHSVIHPRCGTNFAFIVVMMSIVIFTFLPHSPWLFARVGWRLAALPVVAAVSFELLRLAGRFRGQALTNLLIAPGLLMQRLTTREPSDDMLSVAVVSLEAVRAAEEHGTLRSTRLETATV